MSGTLGKDNIMGIFSSIGNLFHGNNGEDLRAAEAHIREQSPLYRHYNMIEVKNSVEQFTGTNISQRDAAQIVQKVRDEKGWGPVKDHLIYDEEMPNIVYCRRCGYTHGGGQC